MMLIGTSVSACILAMVNGAVDPSHVSKIVGCTSARTPEEWDEVIGRYRDLYWKTCADRAEILVREFLAAGRIEQPKILTGLAPLRNGGIWVSSESEITWG